MYPARTLPSRVFFAVFALLGYFAGRHHNVILTCEDFEIAGQYVPKDCRPERD